MSAPVSTQSLHEPQALAAGLAARLRPLPIDPERAAWLQRRVIERVRRSAAAQRDLITVRREDGAWATVGPGVRRRALHATDAMSIDLFMLDAGAPLAWPHDAAAQEILVVAGTLALAARAAEPIRLDPLSQIVRAREDVAGLTAGAAGATVYVRRRRVELDRLPAAEAQWWAQAQCAGTAPAGPGRRWARVGEGTEATVLHAHGRVASMLIRLGPWATLPDHSHSLDEDCYMLEGDIFLGDLLVRAGDYQLARAGGRHVGVVSEDGGLFYFHGAVPGCASGEPR